MSTETEADITQLERNLEEFEDFEPLPAGNYIATIAEVDKRVSENNNEYYYVVFEIPTEAYPADYDVENNPEGTKLVYSRLQALDMTNRRSITAMKKWYRALGLSLATSTIDHNQWEGNQVKLNLKMGEWQGEKRPEIAAIDNADT